MSTRFFENFFANHFINRIGHKAAFALAMLLCLLWSTAAALRALPESVAAAATHEWPREWDGAPLRPMALSEVEQRFADRFPGAIGRMTDGTQTIVMRAVNAPTRMLHPAADCYRALGFRIEQARLERDAQARLWRCFVAQRHGVKKFRVCERIVDAEGAAFTDTSAWYWAAASGQSRGPWQAVTVARPL
ncbi:hypothetical protein [Variovorax paradoxus]|uniref:hypothetical protein n=1 Tax=Variovorax paradoxus TaxID=34073 RepID=UPI003D658DA6